MESIGIFPLYAIGIGLLMFALTFVIKFTRGLLIGILGISVAYYYALASPETKEKMDIYIQRIVKSVFNSNIVQGVKEDTISTLSDSGSALKDYSIEIKRAALNGKEGLYNK